MKIPRENLTLLLTAALSNLLLLAAPPLARAQAPGSIDTALNANVVGSEILASAVQPDGKIIIAGTFSSVLGALRNNIARLNANGTLDMGFDPNANGKVESVVVQADGKVLLGGAFTTLRPNGAPSATTRNRIARVNGDGTLDSFDPNANDLVLSVAVQADGKVLLGGDFTTLQPNGAASPTARNYIARVNGDGTLDTGFDPGANAEVRSVAVQTDGKVLLGGFFTTAAGTTRHFIARVDGVGMIDTGFNPNPDSVVSSVAVQADGKVLLGGFFGALQPNGAPSPTTRNWIARVNGDGTLDTGFDPNADSEILSVAVQADGKVLLGGNFTTLQPNGAASPTARNYIARVNRDGTLDTGFDPNANGKVESVAVQADGKVLLGGIFTTLQPNGAPSPTTRNYFARVNNDTSIQTLSAPNASTVLWERRGGGPALTGQVTFEQSINGGANYTSLGAGTRVGTSEMWQLTGLSLPASGLLRARGRIAGGNYNATSGIVQQVEDFGPAGSLATTFDANVSGGTGVDFHGQATAVQPDGKIIIAGDFTSVLGVPRNNIARLNADGTLDMSFDPNANHQVYCVAVQPDGKVLLGGPFTTLQPNGAVSPTPRNRIARVNADGTLDTSFDPNANNLVQCMAEQADGKVLLGGFFTALQPNGAPSPTTRNRIARVNSDGTLDTGFDPNANSRVRSVAVQADGKVLLGGDFTTLGPGPTFRHSIARVDANGTVDTFNPNPNGLVYSVAVQADGKVLLGGTFSTLQPNSVGPITTRNKIARVNTDGTVDSVFDPNANSVVVYNAAVQADGKVLLSGDFTTLQPNGAGSPTTRNRIARVNANGTLDTGFDPNANDVVTSVAVQADGKVLLGGNFTTLQPNGAGSPITRNFFARLNNDGAMQSLTAPDSSSVLWSRGGAGSEVSQVTFENSTNGGVTWTALGNGARVGTSANWQLTGLSLPTEGHLRARGRTTNGIGDGSSGLIEQIAAYSTLPPTLSQVVSRKTHGTLTPPGDLPLTTTGPATIECRSGGVPNGNHTLIFSFLNTLTGVNSVTATATTSSGPQTIPAANITTALSGNLYTVNLAGVPNASHLTVTLNGVTDSANNTGDISAHMDVLLGDVNSSGRTDAGDVTQVRNRTVTIPDTTNPASFRYDVNASGRIDAGDVTATRNATVTVLPP